MSHPIQYQAPLLRRITQEPDIDLTVFFGADFSVRGYQDKGFGVDVRWDVPLLDGYRYEFLPPLRKKSVKARPLIYGILSRLRGRKGEPGFDILWVHGYATLNALHAMTAAKALGIPVLLRAESWLGDRERAVTKRAAKRFFFRGLKALVDAVLPIGTLNAEYWSYYLGADVPQFLVPYAVDNESFMQRCAEARLSRSQLQAELEIDPARPVILFASKLQMRKRCADLLQAYINLCAGPGVSSHPYLVIVGDGEQRPMLEAQALASGLDGIRFCGFRNQTELPRFFDLASVFVLPSQHEPWGLVVNEVMNAGRPVIVSSDVGCQPDLVMNGLEGCVFPMGDVAALTDALHSILATSGTAERMGRCARERIQQWSFEDDVRGLRQAIADVTRGIEP